MLRHEPRYCGSSDRDTLILSGSAEISQLRSRIAWPTPKSSFNCSGNRRNRWRLTARDESSKKSDHTHHNRSDWNTGNDDEQLMHAVSDLSGVRALTGIKRDAETHGGAAHAPKRSQRF